MNIDHKQVVALSVIMDSLGLTLYNLWIEHDDILYVHLKDSDGTRHTYYLSESEWSLINIGKKGEEREFIDKAIDCGSIDITDCARKAFVAGYNAAGVNSNSDIVLAENNPSIIFDEFYEPGRELEVIMSDGEWKWITK